MSFVQRLVTSIVGKETAARIQAESESWYVTCPNCQTETSIWALGGIRYKAKSSGKKTSVKCHACGQRHMMPVQQKR